jgi:putative transposase
MGADNLLDTLSPLILRHGIPDYIRSDNGPEFIGEVI